MKKLAVLLLSVCILLGTAGCYFVDGGKFSTLKGTYQLTTLHRSYQDVEIGSVDVLQTKEIVAYLIIYSQSEAYYVYGDKNNELTCYQVSIRLEYSQENSSLVEYVTFRDGDGGHLGYHKKNKTLSQQLPAFTIAGYGRNYSETTTYTRVSTAADLSYVQQKLGETLTPVSGVAVPRP